ncbi:MAG: 3-oxoacyl-ACP reductase FabG [bacterium]
MSTFKGQTAIVTGGTRGIGRGIAESFLRSGANVIVTYHANEQAAEKFLKDNIKYKNQLTIRKFDICLKDEVEEFYRFVEKDFEDFEILINNSGIRKDAVCGMMKESDWCDVINVNLTGTFHMCKYALFFLVRKRYGRIINITSPSGRFGFAGQSNYAASKAGLIGFTRSLSKEVATRKITVNCVSPGYIETEFLDDIPQKLRKEYCAQVPLKRFGTAEEVAAAVLFLASREASYITGSVLEVSGGL